MMNTDILKKKEGREKKGIKVCGERKRCLKTLHMTYYSHSKHVSIPPYIK